MSIIRFILLACLIIFSSFKDENKEYTFNFKNTLKNENTEVKTNYQLSALSYYNLIDNEKGNVDFLLTDDNEYDMIIENTFSYTSEAIVGTINSKIEIKNFNPSRLIDYSYMVRFNKRDFSLCLTQPNINININYLVYYDYFKDNKLSYSSVFEFKDTINYDNSIDQITTIEDNHTYMNLNLNVKDMTNCLPAGDIVYKKVAINISYKLESVAVVGDLAGTKKYISNNYGFELSFDNKLDLYGKKSLFI